MKNLFKVFKAMRSIAIIALVALIGFSFAACSDGGGGGGGGGGNSALLGKWYFSQEMADTMPEYYAYWFQSNGKLLITYGYMETTYTATATQIKATGRGWSDYTISGNVLTITNSKEGTADGSGFTDGTYYKGSK
jgi:hypothetical protein